jgi:outer membrane receptor for ferrienterochelin and colicins
MNKCDGRGQESVGMRRVLGWPVAILLFLVATASVARAQSALPELSLEELMRLDAGRVFGASERAQPVTEAPSSVSFITAEEIARHGYRSLAEILQAMRGLTISSDRNFSLLGARGFATPGDYNSRILLLVNGHRVNDNVFGQAEIGPEFGLDPATFERVEIIRGPASSIYGDSAFFGVVNVVTKSGESIAGSSVAVETGTLGTQLVRGSTGQRFDNGAEVALSATFENVDGAARLYFPAHDSPATNNGIAEGLDGERVGQFYGQASVGPLTFTGAYGRRRRTVPTASFGTIFNEQVSPEETVDRHTLADLEYTRTFASGARLSIRGSFDRFTYDGRYPFPTEAPGVALLAHNRVDGSRWSAATRLTQPLPGAQVLTLGTELIDNFNQDQFGEYLDPPLTLLDLDKSSIQTALYIQDEIKLAPWLIVNGGARYDHYENFERVTPRAAFIVIPSAEQSFKYLYGRAFRAPNVYERNEVYFGERVLSLRPESIDTHELVWERYTNDWLRTSVSGYWYGANRLITLVGDETTLLGASFVNEGRVRAAGLEFEAQLRPNGRLQGVVSYAVQRAKDSADRTLVNSPRHALKLRLSTTGPVPGSTIALDARYVSARQTLRGATLNGVAVADVTVVAPLTRAFEIVGSVRNLLDATYADPASDAHLDDAIPQNGISARIGFRWTFKRN